jgi:hypothetical protein
MSLEFGQLHASIVALRTAVGFLEGVAVAHVPDQLPGRGEGCLALLALVGSSPCVRVDVVGQGGKRLEPALTDVTLKTHLWNITKVRPPN